jgi:hypothetical protein
MGGKSTFLEAGGADRSARAGGKLRARRRAEVGIVDRLFSRVGASDNLARGRSTFMVEMVETAAILAQASPQSLVILDEIGRGTSTYDGLAIAWAVVEAMHDEASCRTLFATHYHELTPRRPARLAFPAPCPGARVEGRFGASPRACRRGGGPKLRNCRRQARRTASAGGRPSQGGACEARGRARRDRRHCRGTRRFAAVRSLGRAGASGWRPAVRGACRNRAGLAHSPRSARSAVPFEASLGGAGRQ